MPGRASSVPPTPKAIRRQLERLAGAWNAPILRALTVERRPSLRTTLGRYRTRTRTVELSERVWASPEWPEILTHEAAHAAATASAKGARQPPHGPEWRRLMALAGYPEARGSRWRGCLPTRGTAAAGEPRRASSRYLHTCTVCDFHRTARRPMRAWRCAACVAAGLTGELQITRMEASR